MDSAISSPVIQLLLEKIVTALEDEFGLLWGVKGDIRKLQKLLMTVRDVLHDAERKTIVEDSLRRWLRDLKDAALDADDIVDEFETEALRLKRKGLNSINRKVHDFFSSHNSVAFRFKMAHKIKDINTAFTEIAARKANLIFPVSPASLIESEGHTDLDTYSFIEKSEVFGRDDDILKIKEYLIEKDNDYNLSIFPIIGLGGVGKTTLAQLVFNDDDVQKEFEIRIWVPVGEKFDARGVVRVALGRATKEVYTSDLEDLEALQTRFRKCLKSRYLLILDDVWHEKHSNLISEWEKLKPLLKGEKQGNKIIVTTRSQEVARLMGTVDDPLNLEVLSDDDCWILFKDRAFGRGKQEETPNLVRIGKNIVRKCGGLPMAAKSLGSLMATKREEMEWLAVQNSEIWELDQNDDGILPALKISYDHLPPHLKQCFAYCSIFPKDTEIFMIELIQLWIAEGFVQDETIGRQYFNSLVRRSLIQVEETHYWSGTVTCLLHDLVHDLACLVAKDECCTILDPCKGRKVSQCCRYSSIVSTNGSTLETTMTVYEAKKLRSLTIFKDRTQDTKDMYEFLLYVVTNMTHLRALLFHFFRIKKIPWAIGKLKHLRFLDLSNCNISSLPNSIANLYNLHTLKVRSCTDLVHLPEGMGNMAKLRHLDAWYSWKIETPPNIGRLTNLQTLGVFRVGEEVGQTIEELKNLNLIMGEICIMDLLKVKDSAQAATANLGAKTNLTHLKLTWKSEQYKRTHGSVPPSQDFEDIIENLRPSNFCTKIQFVDYVGSWLPHWITSLSNLVEFVVKELENCECLPALGSLPSLEKLKLSDLPAVTTIGEEFYGAEGTFAKLKYFKLSKFYNLEELLIPGREMFPSLEYFYIKKCPKLRIQPHLPSSMECLTSLDITHSNAALLTAEGCLQKLTGLRTLKIDDCEKSWPSTATTGWDGILNLPQIEEMFIANSSDLTLFRNVIMKQHFPSFRTLNFYKMPNLEPLSVEGPLQPPLFSVLHHLSIWDCNSLRELPQWVGQLTSLRSLKLNNCPNLESLPEGLQNLRELKQLSIIKCPILDSRCIKDRGVDWHKIAHIPVINIMQD